MVNQRMLGLGTNRNVIRELFEYGNRRRAEVGAENVYDFSLGNPSVPPPAALNESILRILRENPNATCEYLKKVCGEAVAQEGIDTVVLGCLGMAQYGDELERSLGVKVIDPAFLALGWAEMAARLHIRPSRRSVAVYKGEI